MPTLITQSDGSVLWDYDVPEEKPTKKTVAKKAAEAPKPEES